MRGTQTRRGGLLLQEAKCTAGRSGKRTLPSECRRVETVLRTYRDRER